MNSKDNAGKNTARRPLLVLLVAVFACGCGPQYVAPKRPMVELALVVASTDELRIMAVDGLATSSKLEGTGRPEVMLSPGEHVLTVRHERNGYVADAQVQFDAEAGRRYTLKARSQGYDVILWLEVDPASEAPLI